jgi:hypothetical protein
VTGILCNVVYGGTNIPSSFTYNTGSAYCVDQCDSTSV